MHHRERVCRARDERDGLVHRERSPMEPAPKILAGEPLHRQIRCARGRASVRDMADDARVTKLREHWRLATDRERTGDELGVLITGLLDPDAVDAISLSSSVPPLVQGLVAWQFVQ